MVPVVSETAPFPFFQQLISSKATTISVFYHTNTTKKFNGRQVAGTNCVPVHVIKLLSRHSDDDGSKGETELMNILTTMFLFKYLILHEPTISAQS